MKTRIAPAFMTLALLGILTGYLTDPAVTLSSPCLANDGKDAKITKKEKAEQEEVEGDLMKEAVRKVKDGKNQSALTVLNIVIRNDSKHIAALYYRGLVKKRLKKDDEAIIDFEAASKLKPKSAEQHFWRYKALKELGKDDQAEKALAKAKKKGYKCPEPEECSDKKSKDGKN